MSPSQYKKAIKALGLTQERAGGFLGKHPRTSQAYCLGEDVVPKQTAMLLRLMVKYGVTPEEAEMGEEE